MISIPSILHNPWLSDWGGLHLFSASLGLMATLAFRQRRPSFAFRPPKNNSFFITFVKYVLAPILLPLVPKIARVEVEGGGLKRLRQLKGKRVILTPNHAEATEPYVMFQLSKLLGEEFNYLTAREVFEMYFPAGRLLQAIGAYSVVRGMPDRNALRATTEILIEGKHWLVIFPEGVAVGLSDNLMPFQPGIGQFAFRAYEDLVRKDGDVHLYFVPLAIKMVYVHRMDKAIDRALQRLEGKLFSRGAPRGTAPQERLLRLGEALLDMSEKKYGVQQPPGTALSDRITYMKELIISRTAQALNIQERPGQILTDRIRDLINALDQIIYRKVNERGNDEQSYGQKKLEAQVLRNRLETAVNFMGLDECYLNQSMTTERFMDIIGLMEREVFGARRFWGLRKAVVRVGEPLDLKDYDDRYRANKKGALQEISATLESAVRGMLLELSDLCKPLEPSR
ncbi:MAG: Acyltransferase [Syntrophorhabdus sp. PtaU1.Bin002]|nr:MAG: Acyltransferase [Syntrophorhabdus sp. PtaU1.Bin002]